MVQCDQRSHRCLHLYFCFGNVPDYFSDGADGDGSGAAQQQLHDSLYCQVYPYHIQYPQRSLGESSYRIKDDSVGLLAEFFFTRKENYEHKNFRNFRI